MLRYYLVCTMCTVWESPLPWLHAVCSLGAIYGCFYRCCRRMPRFVLAVVPGTVPGYCSGELPLPRFPTVCSLGAISGGNFRCFAGVCVPHPLRLLVCCPRSPAGPFVVPLHAVTRLSVHQNWEHCSTGWQ